MEQPVVPNAAETSNKRKAGKCPLEWATWRSWWRSFELLQWNNGSRSQTGDDWEMNGKWKHRDTIWTTLKKCGFERKQPQTYSSSVSTLDPSLPLSKLKWFSNLVFDVPQLWSPRSHGNKPARDSVCRGGHLNPGGSSTSQSSFWLCRPGKAHCRKRCWNWL